MYKIDIAKFKTLFPNCKNADELCNLMDNLLPQEEINTKERVNAFLAQCGHESGGFTRFVENLNYSAKGLRATFSKYFPDDSTALKYERKPEKIANKVYANRMNNGNESSGDGWKFRGRGPIQLTGKANYEMFSKDTGIDLTQNPDLVITDNTILLKTAIWFWNKNKLNDFADKKDIKSMTKRINGGFIGLEERQHNFDFLMS